MRLGGWGAVVFVADVGQRWWMKWMNFFSVFNFHFPLGNNVCGQKRSSQYCCGSVCLAKTHYTGYYCGRSPGRRAGGRTSLMKILMTLKPKIYKWRFEKKSLSVSLKTSRWAGVLRAAVTEADRQSESEGMFSPDTKLNFTLVICTNLTTTLSEQLGSRQPAVPTVQTLGTSLQHPHQQQRPNPFLHFDPLVSLRSWSVINL